MMNSVTNARCMSPLYKADSISRAFPRGMVEPARENQRSVQAVGQQRHAQGIGMRAVVSQYRLVVWIEQKAAIAGPDQRCLQHTSRNGCTLHRANPHPPPGVEGTRLGHRLRR